jgi:hypothetical protein
MGFLFMSAPDGLGTSTPGGVLINSTPGGVLPLKAAY